MKQSIKTSALSAFICMFLVAFLLAFIWRFPIPFSGYETGKDAAFRSILAVGFYGICGGFIIVPGLGAAAGAFAYKIYRPDTARAKKLSIIFGFFCALLCGIIFSVLDRLIGVW